jgi:hypothetical protein
VEGDGGDNEEKSHELHGAEQNSSATNAVYGDEVDKGEEEVDTCDNGSDGDGVTETNLEQ